MHVAIAGNIGSGKTTLTRMLAKHYGWTPRLEAVSYNPYLEDYYKDIQRWSLNLEVYFLKERFKDVLEINRSQQPLILDRSIYEGVYVFTRNNYLQGNMSERDYETYMELFDNLTGMVQYPTLMIYLRSGLSHLVANIQKRGRDYEQQISLEYLKGLNNLYEEFITQKYKGPVLIIDVDDMDYEHNPKDFLSIVQKIDQRLFSLFDF